jgi:hypothetical protein
MAGACLSRLADGIDQGICAGPEDLKSFEVKLQPGGVESGKTFFVLKIFIAGYDIWCDFSKLPAPFLSLKALTANRRRTAPRARNWKNSQK